MSAITPRMREFLEWVQVAEPYASWPVEWSTMHRKARDAGLVAKNGRESGTFGFIKWGLTDAGRKALLDG